MAKQDTKFMKNVKQKRTDSFPKSFDIAYDSFIALGFDQYDKNFFLENASECIEKLREECWKEFLKAEDNFTKRILKDAANQMVFDGLTTYDSVYHFIDEHVYDIYDLCLSNTQSRRSRAGKEFEAIIEMMLIGSELPYDGQGNIGKEIFTKKGLGKMVDEVVPGVVQYNINKRRCILISAKTTLRERWQEVSEEMARTGAKEMFLATLDEKISNPVLQSLSEENIVITTTKSIKDKYYKNNVEVITFEDLLQICSDNKTYWENFNYTDEQYEEILDNFNQQYENHLNRHPYVAKYALKMIKDLKNK